jgi:hypothetical protein
MRANSTTIGESLRKFVRCDPMRRFGLLLLSCGLCLTATGQPVVITYQGHVLDNGTAFNGVGLFKFALVVSSNNVQATATAQLTGSFVTGVTVDQGGSGYTSAPSVSFTGGGGSGATATATVSNGMVVAITVNLTGNNYTNPPTVIIAPPPPGLGIATLWSNDGTSVNGSEPTFAVPVGVTNGLFTVGLGDTNLSSMQQLDAAIFIQPNLQLRIWFNDGVHGSTALSPLQNLTSAPYAVTAQNLAAVVQNNTTVGGFYQAIGGGIGNSAGQYFDTIGGGENNTENGFDATIGGGEQNHADGNTSTVGGGYANYSTGSYSTIAGGNNNISSNTFSTVGGGYQNTAGGYGSTVAGGYQNTCSTLSYSAIGGGLGNTATANYATIPGGYQNTVGGSFSFAAGFQAQAMQFGSFVWNDESGGSFSSSTANTFYARANGGFLFYSQAGITMAGDVSLAGGATSYHHLSLSGGNAFGYLYGSFPALGDGVHLGYNYYYDNSGIGHISNTGGGTSRISAEYGEIVLAVGGVNAAPTTPRVDVTLSGVTVSGTFSMSSDRNVKQDFAPINPSQILDKVLELPLSEWSYITDANTRHIGPMGQDFYSIFNVGTDEKHIAPIDEGGVALAAIQGLNQKLEQKDAEIQKLNRRLEKLEQLLSEKTGGEK